MRWQKRRKKSTCSFYRCVNANCVGVTRELASMQQNDNPILNIAYEALVSQNSRQRTRHLGPATGPRSRPSQVHHHIPHASGLAVIEKSSPEPKWPAALLASHHQRSQKDITTKATRMDGMERRQVDRHSFYHHSPPPPPPAKHPTPRFLRLGPSARNSCTPW